MAKKISDISDARKSKRRSNGWSMDEIKAQARKDLDNYRRTAKGNPEPEGLCSGDMEKLIKDAKEGKDEQE
jgi:hypothetical protein